MEKKSIGTMSLRRVVALAFACGALAIALVLVVAGWWIHGAAVADPAGGLPAIKMGGGTIAAAVIALAVVWVLLDRHLLRREIDHRSLPSRPEFFDFEDLNQPMHLSEMAGRPLKELDYVVFDTETTGLRPSQGDEIISIAGVHVRAGEIDEAEPYTRLVDPGMAIPKETIPIHGITDDMVAGESPVGDVLPGFKDFVGTSILVAHNAAFDMKFLRLKEQATGVVFDNLVLDSLLLSVFLEHESQNHSLDAIAERLGIVVEGRHTALGDSLVTARVFLRMLDMLEARGITTLRQAVDVSSRIEHVRKMQERF